MERLAFAYLLNSYQHDKEFNPIDKHLFYIRCITFWTRSQIFFTMFTWEYNFPRLRVLCCNSITHIMKYFIRHHERKWKQLREAPERKTVKNVTWSTLDEPPPPPNRKKGSFCNKVAIKIQLRAFWAFSVSSLGHWNWKSTPKRVMKIEFTMKI